jgi:hypothetical protein
MYTLIVRTQNLPEVSIIHGPHSSPSFDTNTWIKAGMDPGTVNILSRLPFSSAFKRLIGPDMAPMPYLKDAPTSNLEEEEDEDDEHHMHFDSWTDPFVLDDETRYIEVWYIPLTSANHGGYVLILDCKISKSPVLVLLKTMKKVLT